MFSCFHHYNAMTPGFEAGFRSTVEVDIEVVITCLNASLFRPCRRALFHCSFVPRKIMSVADHVRIMEVGGVEVLFAALEGHKEGIDVIDCMAKSNEFIMNVTLNDANRFQTFCLYSESRRCRGYCRCAPRSLEQRGSVRGRVQSIETAMQGRRKCPADRRCWRC